jgi:hypothetical protein
LDLSKNSLKDVAGLECLHKYGWPSPQRNGDVASFLSFSLARRLRFLNLSDNPKLKWKAVLSKLRNVTTLEKANLCVTMEGHPRQADNKKYRAYVLKELLLNNPDLFAVDEVPITPAERVETFRSMKGVKSEKAEHYRFLLAVNINSTQPTNRKYHPEAVAVGKQYDPTKVTSLLRLHNMGIQMANFRYAPLNPPPALVPLTELMRAARSRTWRRSTWRATSSPISPRSGYRVSRSSRCWTYRSTSSRAL